MNVLDDSIHQLFSDILFSKGHAYEGTSFPQASGFTFDKMLILDGSPGILGLRHPLKIKTSLVAALHPNLHVTTKETEELYQEIEDFFRSKVDSFRIGSANHSYPSSFAPGRFNSFFSNHDLELTKNKRINVENVFTFSFSIGNEQASFSTLSSVMTVNDYLYNKSLLRLLKEGQFYDKAGIVSRRSNELRDKVKDIKNINSNGMTIFLKELAIPNHIISSEGHLILPLYYPEEDLKNLIEKLKEISCSS